MKENFSYNLILLGGTGARCGEIFVHMCANGYVDVKAVNILYIDSDTKNGNAVYFKQLVKVYRECREKYLIKESPIPCFFRPQIHLMIENPVRGTTYFKDLVNKPGVNIKGLNGAEMLMKALYSEEECEMKVSDGFFAHPNVGAALFAANIEAIMERFLKIVTIAQRDMKKIKIFMIGSIFGGTGASSLPTISKYLKNKLFGDSDNKLIGEQMQIGGCMALPYFSFARDELTEEVYLKDDIEIQADKFVTKTKAALNYYKYIDGDYEYNIFDKLYILGDDRREIRGNYETAGSKQRNLPHIVEFYAAMAGATFFESKIGEKGHYFGVVSKDKIGWKDIYKKTEGFFNFFIMMRFSIVMRSLILEEMFDYTENNKMRKTASAIPWYYDFLDGKGKSSDMKEDRLYGKFESIAFYCSEYIRWFAELNISNIDKLNIPDKIEYEKEENRRKDPKPYEESDVDEDLEFFSKRLVISQYVNNLISSGALKGNYTKDVRKNIYKENLKYIRKHFKELEKLHSFTDWNTERIGMKDIWERLTDFGFNFSVKDEAILKNIQRSADKSMDAGVRNLVNAIYIACMI